MNKNSARFLEADAARPTPEVRCHFGRIEAAPRAHGSRRFNRATLHLSNRQRRETVDYHRAGGRLTRPPARLKGQ
jgi:hypothetical protein